MAEEHRCFLAIDIEPNLINKIEEIQKEFKQTNNNNNNNNNVKYVEKENLHFTLKFFGNIDSNKIDEIKKAIKSVLANLNSKPDNDSNDLDSENELSIEGIGTFPNKNYMKVLWIGTKDNIFLTNLQKELDSEFINLGFKKEKNFKTHLTIGRIRNLKNKKEFKEKIEELEDIKIGKMDINKLSLKESELTPKGPIYSNIETFNL
ncbi:MAG: RNA 2',3'-cyclic phosphodiesterase [Methanobrevibacter sp.]|nr:RNA 2',3'-cyclic phosphodiesterase [Methanobrevibacter sp.]